MIYKSRQVIAEFQLAWAVPPCSGYGPVLMGIGHPLNLHRFGTLLLSMLRSPAKPSKICFCITLSKSFRPKRNGRCLGFGAHSSGGSSRDFMLKWLLSSIRNRSAHGRIKKTCAKPYTKYCWLSTGKLNSKHYN